MNDLLRMGLFQSLVMPRAMCDVSHEGMEMNDDGVGRHVSLEEDSLCFVVCARLNDCHHEHVKQHPV